MWRRREKKNEEGNNNLRRRKFKNEEEMGKDYNWEEVGILRMRREYDEIVEEEGKY